MKMRKAEHFVRSSSSIAGQTFNVKMSDKLFETLFSTLYKYKEAAATRETLCNAIDSHTMRERQQKYVGTHYAPLTPPPARYNRHLAPPGTKVIVHLPDDMEPWLEIKDFGVGLSLEQIVGDAIPAREDEVLIQGNVVVKEDEIPEGSEVIGVPDFYGDRLVFRGIDNEIIRTPGLYTTLFHSTKELDDGQIGAFGLGSKSPFAVSDTFTVESRYDGKLYRFLMYLNKDRIPTVDIITKDLETRDPTPEDTDEFNGLTIRIPVKNTRYLAFENELIRLGKVMRPDMRPEVDNSSYNFEWQEISFDDRVANTYIQPKGGDNQKHYAVMGGVSYPINLEQLDDDIQSVLSRFPSSYTFFELGELNVPPSREDLSYDDYTRENLNSALQKVVRKILEMRKGELRAAAARGPLSLYMAKGRIADIYGSGFRKMLDVEFPSDSRLSSKRFVCPGIPEIDRDYSADGPWFNHVGDPFEIDIHEQGYSASGWLYPADMQRWLEEGVKPYVIIDDNKHARNLKIATARKYHPLVFVVSLNENYMSRRNTARLTDAFKNKAEIISYLESWMGDQDTVNYLTFADKFYEMMDGLVDIGTVEMMSDLKYEKPTVEKDPGMFPFYKDDHDFKLDYHREMKAKDVSEMIDSGKRIIYVTFSGHECTHEIRGKRLRCGGLKKLRAVLSMMRFEVEKETGDVDFESFFDYMNMHQTIVLARRKSVPMMKKHPEVFVPIDEVFEMAVEYHKEIAQRVHAQEILKLRNKLEIYTDRMGYGAHLLTQAFGDAGEYNKHIERITELTKKFDKVVNPEVSNGLKALLRQDVPAIVYKKRAYNLFKEAVNEIGCDMPKDKLSEKAFKIYNQCYQVFEIASDSIEEHGFKRIQHSSRPAISHRQYNRLMVERHRVVQFLKENYKPTMENVLGEQGTFLNIISTMITKR